MDRIVESGINLLNAAGQGFCVHAAGAFVQSSVLIVVLLVLDVLLRKRVRAVVRYSVWLLVFVKLLLPPTLALPTGIGYYQPHRAVVHQRVVEPFTPMPVETARSRPISMTARPSEVVAASGIAPRLVEMTTPAISPTSVRPTIAWQAWVFLAWLVGVVVLCVCLIRRFQYVRKLVRASTPASDPLQGVLAQCAQRLGLGRCPQIRLSDDAPGPVVCRLLRPVVLMPTTLTGKISEDRLRTVLVHELAHIKRADLWVNFAQTLLLVAYFYHPLLWLVNVIVRRLREQAVDETVLVALDAEVGSYSTTLIDLAEMTFHRPILGLRLIGIAESKKALEGRIRHMITRPKPRTARIGLWGLLTIAFGAAVLLPMAAARNNSDERSDHGEFKFLVLDNSDPHYDGKDRYDDRLYLMGSDGTIEAALSGFNVCETIGGAHMMAIDDARRMLWIAENGDGRLFQFDLSTGRLLRSIPDLKARAVAVDAATGNAWVTITEGTIGKGHIQVISRSGETLARRDVAGFDIAYSAYDHSFWVVGKDVYRLDSHGNVLGRITGEIPWTAVSVSVDDKVGNAWIVVRDHAVIAESRPELWCVDGSMEVQQRIDLGDLIPFCVAVDSENETVWVGCLGTTLRYTTQGEKLASARFASGFSVIPGRVSNEVFAADRDGLYTAAVEPSGAVGLGEFPTLRDKLGSSQKWLAAVPVAGAKLPSSPELADLSRQPPEPEEFAPVSAAKLKAFGKALLMYANDYEDKFPDTLQGVHAFVGDEDMAWLQQNIAYLGKGKTTSGRPDIVLAYDKTMLAKGDGALALFLDSHVAFQNVRELEALGIGASPVDVEARVESAARLADLGKALLIYANDHDDEFPEHLSDLRDEVKVGMPWLLENVVYLGKDVSPMDHPARVLAYDKTLLEKGQGTNVLYLDLHVIFESPARLKELGIKPMAKSADEAGTQARVTVLSRLKNLALAAHLYASDNDGVFPDELEALAPYLAREKELWTWARANVTYVGKGAKATGGSQGAQKPLAWCCIPSGSSDEVGVAFQDGHAEFVKGPRLKDLGIEIQP